MAAVASPSLVSSTAAATSGGGGLATSDPHLRHGAKDASHYHWRNTFSGPLRDVGQLTVTVVAASGLKAADFVGKSDPFCSVALGDLEYKSEVVTRYAGTEQKGTNNYRLQRCNRIVS